MQQNRFRLIAAMMRQSDGVRADFLRRFAQKRIPKRSCRVLYSASMHLRILRHIRVRAIKRNVFLSAQLSDKLHIRERLRAAYAMLDMCAGYFKRVFLPNLTEKTKQRRRVRAAADRGQYMTPRAYAAILPQPFHPRFC